MFSSFHYLFGPWTIIIEGLLNDLFKFGVIVMMFIVSYNPSMDVWLKAALDRLNLAYV